jgi:hypothetical protein
MRKKYEKLGERVKGDLVEGIRLDQDGCIGRTVEHIFHSLKSAPPADEPQNLYDWTVTHRRLEDRPFSLENFKPLEALYRDDHPNIVVMKPAQVGISEWAISHAIWALSEGARYWKTDLSGLNVAYCFPTLTALRDFSKERVSGIKRESGYLRELFDSEFDDLGFKQVADSYFYLRGAWSIDAMISFRADVLILDEYDRMDTAAVQLAYKRLRQSPIGRRVQVSTPTLPGRGIHEAYMESDQTEWQTYCKRCKDYLHLEFFRDVRADEEPHAIWKNWPTETLRNASMITVCPRCANEIDRTGTGRWQAQFPEITSTRGYHIPSLAFKVVSLNTLAVLSVSTNPTVLTEFFRSDLGVPYEPAGSRVTMDMLLRLAADLTNGHHVGDHEWKRTRMGIDVGSVYHYRIDSDREGDSRTYVRAMGEARSFEELSILMRQYGVKAAVIDAMPELHGTRDWVWKHPGRAYRAFYGNGLQMWKRKTGDVPAKRVRFERLKATEGDVVEINRTMAMDAVYSSIGEGLEVWPAHIVSNTDITSQMCAPVRVIGLDRHGQEQASWEHTQPDHYYHASVYARIAGEILRQSRQLLGVPGVVGVGSAKGWVGV